MSDEQKKVSGITDLPILPLPLVLMPLEMLPLHIFEPRYIRMLKDVQAQHNMFGVSLLEPNEDNFEKPVLGSIGCATEIDKSQILENGRSNILTTGVIRYRLNEYLESDEPYFVGVLEFFEDYEEKEVELKRIADEVFSLFDRIAKTAPGISGQSSAIPALSKTEPEQLSFLIASAINLDNISKYQMLELRSTSQRLGSLKKILSEAAERLEETVRINTISRANGHANKPINLD